jgi:hypothetical protein
MKLDWRQGILYVTTMGMEGCWLYALMALLNKQVADGRLSVPGVLVLYPVAFLFNLSLVRLRWPRACIQSVSWLGWVVGMLIMVKVQLFGDLPLSDSAWLLSIPRSITEVIYAFRPELLILLSTGVLWWLSWRLARRVCNFPTMVSEFQFGLVMLVLVFFVASQLGATLDNAVPVALSFFLFALVGISVAHALEGTSWLSGLYQGHWSGLLLVSISLILLLGLLVSAVVTPDLLQLLWAAIKWGWGLIWGLILKVLLFLASLFPEPEPAELPPMPTMPAMEPSEEFKLWTMPEWLRSGLRLALSILWIGIILFALWRISSDIFRWLRRKLASMAGAEFEPLPGAFKADFLGLLKRILFRLLGLKLSFRLKGEKGTFPPAVASVRQIYRQLLRWAATGGYPRHISQTPHEYCYTLVGLLPEAREDLDLVTQQYVRTRYGALLSTEDELNELSQAWNRIKQARLKKAPTEPIYEKEVS